MKEIDYVYKDSPYRQLLYNRLKGMQARCNFPSDKNYKNYGARGINVCKEWQGKQGFKNFYYWSMTNGFQPNLTIDRINVNEGYSPNNCRWADAKTQANNKRKTLKVNYNNQEIPLKEYLEIIGKPEYYSKIKRRVKNGLSVAEAIIFYSLYPPNSLNLLY